MVMTSGQSPTELRETIWDKRPSDAWQPEPTPQPTTEQATSAAAEGVSHGGGGGGEGGGEGAGQPNKVAAKEPLWKASPGGDWQRTSPAQPKPVAPTTTVAPTLAPETKTQKRAREAAAREASFDAEDYGPATSRPAMKLKEIGTSYANEQEHADFRVEAGQTPDVWNFATPTPGKNVTEVRTRYLTPEEQKTRDLHAGPRLESDAPDGSGTLKFGSPGSERARRQAEPGAKDVRLRTADGELADTSATKGRSGFGTEGKEIFAMTPKGDIRSADPWALRQEEAPKGRLKSPEYPDDATDSEIDEIYDQHQDAQARAVRLAMANHSSLAAVPHYLGKSSPEWSDQLRAGKVGGAGELRMSEGRLDEVSDRSGHYTPDNDMTAQVLDRFSDMGVDLHDTTVNLSPKATGERAMYASSREFQGATEKVAARRANGETVGENAQEAMMRDDRAQMSKELQEAVEARTQRAENGEAKVARGPKHLDQQRASNNGWWQRPEEKIAAQKGALPNGTKADASALEHPITPWGVEDSEVDARQARFKKPEGAKITAVSVDERLRARGVEPAVEDRLRPLAPASIDTQWKPKPVVEEKTADKPLGNLVQMLFGDDVKEGKDMVTNSSNAMSNYNKSDYNTSNYNTSDYSNYNTTTSTSTTNNKPDDNKSDDNKSNYSNYNTSNYNTSNIISNKSDYNTSNYNTSNVINNNKSDYNTSNYNTSNYNTSNYNTSNYNTSNYNTSDGGGQNVVAEAKVPEPVVKPIDPALVPSAADVPGLPVSLRRKEIYKTKEIDAKYRGEQADASNFRGSFGDLGMWDQFASTPGASVTKATTKYLTPMEQQEHELTSKDGLLQSHGKEADTSNAVGIGIQNQGAAGGARDGESGKRLPGQQDRFDSGKHMFVLSPQGALRAMDPWAHHTEEPVDGQAKGSIQMNFLNHSSLAADVSGNAKTNRNYEHELEDGDVAAAGELQIEKGRLQQISDASGHYQPDNKMTGQAIDKLADMGVDMHDTALKLTAAQTLHDMPANRDTGKKPTRALHASVREFQEMRGKLDEDDEYETRTPADLMMARREGMKANLASAMKGREARAADGQMNMTQTPKTKKNKDVAGRGSQSVPRTAELLDPSEQIQDPATERRLARRAQRETAGATDDASSSTDRAAERRERMSANALEIAALEEKSAQRRPSPRVEEMRARRAERAAQPGEQPSRVDRALAEEHPNKQPGSFDAWRTEARTRLDTNEAAIEVPFLGYAE